MCTRFYTSQCNTLYGQKSVNPRGIKPIGPALCLKFREEDGGMVRCPQDFYIIPAPNEYHTKPDLYMMSILSSAISAV